MDVVKDNNNTGKAYRSIRGQILACRLLPGEKLVISDLCAQIGVSLGAVREALARLTSEGLATLEPNKGYRVTAITLDELVDLTSVRILIESQCIRNAIVAGDLSWEGRIVSALYELSRIPLQDIDDPGRINEEWTRAHYRFHEALVAACDSPWLIRLRELLYVQSERYRQMSVPLARLARNVNAEHQAIADAIIGRDTALSERLMSEHLDKTTKILIDAHIMDAADRKKCRKVSTETAGAT